MKPQNENDFAEGIDHEPFIAANARAKSRFGRFNLAVVGGTGVGKSALVNAVFGEKRAKESVGLPETLGVHYYTDNTLGIWDIEGFEIGSHKTPAEAMRAHLEHIGSGPDVRKISVVWYCVLAMAGRLTPADIGVIRELDAAGLPVVLVLTKVRWEKNPVTGKYKEPKEIEEFIHWLEDPTDRDGNPIDIPIRHIIPTASKGRGAGQGLGRLVAETLALSPEDEKDAFRIAQRLNIKMKRELARPVVVAATTAAGAAAAVPIPVADAAALAPIQMSMMGRIAAIYELEIKSILSAQGLAQMGAQIAGKALARSFIKLIPGAGSMVNAAVASALTAATGEAWIRLCEKVYLGEVDLANAEDVWRDFSPTISLVLKKMFEQRGDGKGPKRKAHS